MAWLDDHREREFQTFRARFTDEQWDAFERGECPRVTVNLFAGAVLCRAGRLHARIYCQGCTELLRALPTIYGALVVPSSVRSMDLSADEPWRTGQGE